MNKKTTYDKFASEFKKTLMSFFNGYMSPIKYMHDDVHEKSIEKSEDDVKPSLRSVFSKFVYNEVHLSHDKSQLFNKFNEFLQKLEHIIKKITELARDDFRKLTKLSWDRGYMEYIDMEHLLATDLTQHI